MNPQSLIAFTPFLAVLYIVYALIQALRKKRQGIGAALLAFIALVAPVAALIVNQDMAVQLQLSNFLMINAIIVFVGSINVLMLERRNPVKDSSRSYGMLGVGLGVLLAVEILAYPTLASTLNTSNTSIPAGFARSDGSTLQNVVQTTSLTTDGLTAFAEVLTAQTGLTLDEITTQLQSGSTVVDLVAQNNGDLDAVIAATASTLDELAGQDGMPAQMISQLGDDTTTIATQYVQGELADERAQQFLTMMLLGGEMPSLPQGGGNPPAGGSDTFPDSNAAPESDPNSNANESPANNQSGQEPNVQPADAPAAPTDGSTAFAEVLTAQTGLTIDEITTQLQSGSTVVDLVAQNNGDLDAVIAATASTLDELAGQDGMPAQMISQLGDDTTTIATQYVQGELADERAQQFLTMMLLGGEMPLFPQGGGNPPAGGDGALPPANNGPETAADQNANDGQSGSQPDNQNVAQEPPLQPTESPATPTETVIRPTVISFPSATPTPLTAEVSVDESSAAEAAATCTVTALYNLNFRNQPNTTDSTVYLSIPSGTSVVANGRTADGWYSVTYDGQAGWVSGEYVNTNGTCDNIATVDAG